MAGQEHLEATPGQRAAPPAPGGWSAALVARLESQRTSACLHPTRAAPTPRRAPAASLGFASHHGRNPLPGAACALAPLVGRAARSQCAHGNRWASSDHVVWHPNRFCHLTRFRGGVTSRFRADRLLLLEQAGFSDRILLARFLAGSHLFLSAALFALYPTILAGSSGLPCQVLYDFRLQIND